MKRKGLWILIGMLLFLAGSTAIILQLIGVSWYFLAFLDNLGGPVAFLVKILMVIAGVITVVVANTDWERERKESE